MLVNGVPSGIYSWEQNSYMNFVIPWGGSHFRNGGIPAV